MSNQGPGAASGITLVDTLPAGTSYLSACPGCSQAGGEVTCALGSLANGDNTTINITIQAPQQLGMVTNTATVSASEPDLNPDDNQASADVTVISYQVNLPLLVR